MKYILIFFVICSIGFADNMTKTWLTDSASKQLQKEGIDDQLGYGRVFVPAYTRPEWEPPITIYSKGGKVLYNMKIGMSIFLEPGEYRMIFGSAAHLQISQRKYYKHHCLAFA